MTATLKGLEFDPGFAPYILEFRGTVEYLYLDVNRFKNFSQKKMKFMQYHKKFLEMFENNLGFYIGCLMWATYIQTQPKQDILSNHCFGQKYDEEQNIADTQFMLNFVENYSKDVKYYLAKDFSFNENYSVLINLYQDFLILNQGFVETKYNTDIVLPEGLKTDKSERFKSIIEDVLKTKDLSNFIEYLSEIL